MKTVLFVVLLCAAGSVLAQQVPSISGVAQLPGDMGGGPEIPLNVTEREAVRIVEKWNRRRARPGMGNNGGVVYMYGANMPSIICRPLHVCDVAMQTGEIVMDINIGDSVRWQVTPAIQGGNGRPERVHLIIKPNDAGLRTNMMVTTDRRVYHLTLISSKKRSLHAVEFVYPEDQLAQWKALRQRQLQKASTVAAELPKIGIDELNLEYTINGKDLSFAPVRVFDDGEKTWFELKKGWRIQAALFAVENDQPLLINYRRRGGHYIVDRLADTWWLVYGQDNKKVVITRGKETCSWFCGGSSDERKHSAEGWGGSR